MTVLALHHDSVKTQHSNSYSQDIVGNWQLNLAHIRFAEDFSFAQFFHLLVE
jgi:hypothetical protein